MADIQVMDSNCKTCDVDISQLCRLCAAQDENPVPIFEGPGLELELEVKLQKYLSLMVFENDELPHLICKKCFNTLTLWHELVIGCKEAEKRFLSLLSERRTTTNADDVVILVDEGSQDSVKIIENDDQPSSKPDDDQFSSKPADDDSFILRNTLRAKLGKLLRGPGLVNDTIEGHLGSSSDSRNIVPVSTNTATSQHGPKLLCIDQSQATVIGGITQLEGQSSNSTVIHPRFGLVAVGSSISTKETVLMSQGLVKKKAVLIKRNAGQLLLKQSKPASSKGTLHTSKCLDRGNALITQTSNGQLIYGSPPSNCGGNFVQVLNNQSGNIINVRSVIQPSSGQQILSQSPYLADLADDVGGDDLRGPSPCPSDTFIRPSSENMPVEAAGRESATQSKIFEEVVNKSASATVESVYVSSYGDHGYSKSVKVLKNSATAPKNKDDTDMRHCLSYAAPRKSENRKCFVCGKMIHNRTLLFSHEKNHFRTLKSLIHECRLCTDTFRTFDEMVSHRRKHQKEGGDVFSICGKHKNVEEVKPREEVTEPKSPEETSFADDDFGTSEVPGDDVNPPEVSIKKSKSSGKTTPGMRCSMCGLFFKKKLEVYEHKLTHSEEERAKPYPCLTCGKRFNTSHSLKLHSELHSDVTELCPHCGRIFKQRAALNAHIRRKHGDPTKLPSHQCKFCPRTFEFPGKLLVHMRCHTGERPYVCDVCGKSFRTPGTFTQHRRCHEDARPRKCKICGKGFKWTKNLIQHSMTHVSKHLRPNRSKQKPIQCNVCGKTLHNYVSAKLHKYKFHRDVFLLEYPESEGLVCHLCPRLFSKQTSLDNHLEQFHANGDKGFRCDFCPKRFALKARRDAHARLHTGERPFQCQHCDKSFAASSYLKAHLVCHSEARRYSCQYCDKQFKKKSHLNVHVRSHTGEKPYVCDVCGRRFTQVSEKNRHRGTHFDGRPFECTTCESFFKKKQELVDHMAEQHPEAVDPEHVFEEEIEIDYSAILPSDFGDCRS